MQSTPSDIKKIRKDTFSGNIWKILADPYKPYLLLEIRHYDTRSVFFSIFNMKKCNFARKKIKLHENWWVSVEQCKNGLIFFHGFKDDQFALHEGLTIYDIDKNKVLWQQHDYTFHYLLQDSIVVSDPEDNFLKVSIREGNVIDQAIDLNTLPKEEITNTILIFPVQYLNGTEYFTTVSGFIRNNKLGEPVKAIEYLEIQNFIVISYYILDQNLLLNKLVIFDLNGKLLHNDTIDQNLKGIGSETFFIYDNFVIYIKQKTQLLIYEMV